MSGGTGGARGMKAPTEPISEAEFQRQVTELCDWLHLWWHHTPDSRRSNAGMPDLLVVNLVTGAVLFIELKAEAGRLTLKQQQVLTALELGGHDVLVAKPRDWSEVQRRLRDLAARTTL